MYETYVEKQQPTKKNTLELIHFCSINTQHEYFDTRKLCARNGDGYEIVHSEFYRGGYIISDNEVALSPLPVVPTKSKSCHNGN